MLIVVLILAAGALVTVGLTGRRPAAARRALTPTRTGATGTRPAGPLVPASGVLLGAFVSSSGTGWAPADVSARETQLGRRFAIDHRFQNWTVEFPTPADHWDVDQGRIPMITWQPDTTTLAATAAGREDAVVRARAAAVRDFGRPLFLRFAHEMNADWYPWSGTRTRASGSADPGATYVAAWRHVHDVFVAAGATNAVWVWSPNRASIPDEPWNAAVRYYPGDAYVDWVAVDGYDRDQVHRRSFTTLFGPLYDAFAGRKPIMIGETATVEGPTPAAKAAWIADAQRAVTTRFPAVAAVVWFDARKAPFDWRIDSSPAALAAFRALATDPYFGARAG
jgi:hypothetical protein